MSETYYSIRIPNNIKVLHFLSCNSVLSRKDLILKTEMNKSTVPWVLNRLLKSGLIKRTEYGHYAITDKGIEHYNEWIQVRKERELPLYHGENISPLAVSLKYQRGFDEEKND